MDIRGWKLGIWGFLATGVLKRKATSVLVLRLLAELALKDRSRSLVLLMAHDLVRGRLGAVEHFVVLKPLFEILLLGGHKPGLLVLIYSIRYVPRRLS